METALSISDWILEYSFYLVLILLTLKFFRFMIMWIFIILEDICHMFVPYHKHYDLWFFKKVDNLLNKFRWRD